MRTNHIQLGNSRLLLRTRLTIHGQSALKAATSLPAQPAANWNCEIISLCTCPSREVQTIPSSLVQHQLASSVYVEQSSFYRNTHTTKPPHTQQNVNLSTSSFDERLQGESSLSFFLFPDNSPPARPQPTHSHSRIRHPNLYLPEPNLITLTWFN